MSGPTTFTVEPFNPQCAPGTGKSHKLTVSFRLKTDAYEKIRRIAYEAGTTHHDLARQMILHCLSCMGDHK